MLPIKLRALVVDDSRVMRQMIVQNLKAAGIADFTITEATNGVDALRKMAIGDFHLALIDWHLPKINGIELIQTVKALAQEANEEAIPMAMITTERTLDRVQEAMDNAGADAFISKPFTHDELKTKLERLVQLAVDVRVRKMRKDHQNAAPVSGSVFAKLFG
jgi:two-component system, chemotaxis family, chemotaxis protein CheY